ncbi:MAG: RdgB/HAM1 family non-canonical purine NTP pyrophosphatase [Bifidobacteriaceae bacterium]|jgi:XTP/dITP diphosphohydrolase|nr:RdgB/HAM1 family non-canonical purine NTP pyrophosphatase [Bifidobacteriaceae bacterium]
MNRPPAGGTASAGGAHRVLVLATHNAHKVRELRAILAEADALGPLEVVGASELGVAAPLEDGLTFQENALLKARFVAQATGLAAVGDDSGLCVAALGGAPGVFSARWAGGHGDDAANLALLLDQLRDVPEKGRAAWFECAAVLALPGGGEHAATGRMEGRLAYEPRGAGGFGYDPILIPDGFNVTSAELEPGQKNAISHRGKAFRTLAPAIRALWC